MTLGEKLLELRKEKHLSQEEVADRLNVSRQTVSKWETNVSTPDFDKIVPICELFEISTNELLTGAKDAKENVIIDDNRQKKAKGIGVGVLTYFIAIVWIMITIPVFNMNPIVSTGVFLIICGLATAIIIYTCISYKENKKEVSEENKLIKKIDGIVSIITLVIYLLISFLTMAWYITWILWIVNALVIEIIKLILMLKGDKNEK